MQECFDFTLRPRPPFSWKLTACKPAGWSLINHEEVWKDGVLWSADRLGTGKPVGFKIWSTGGTENAVVHCRVWSKGPLDREEGAEARKIIETVIAVDQDLKPFYKFASKLPVLKQTVKDLYGMHYGRGVGNWPDAIIAITLQMAPVKRSLQMLGAIVQNYGDKIAFDGKSLQIYPTPKQILRVSEAELRERCKLGYRAKFLLSVAKSFAKGEVPTPAELQRMSAEEAITALTSRLHGIGRYSAQVMIPHITMSMAIDVWSVKIFAQLFSIKMTKPAREMIPVVEKWADKNLGQLKGLAFIYIMHDMPGLEKAFGIDLGTYYHPKEGERW